MAVDNRKFISLTHFINPQLFWYHKIDVPNEGYHEIVELEQQLEDFYKGRSLVLESIRPPVGALVAVNFLGWNKLIRARVDEIANFSRNMQHSGEYVMWALDYGFPFQTQPEYIYRLPEKFARHINHIRCGGLAGVLPGEKEFDFMEGRAVMMAKDHWCQRACDTVDKLLTEAASIELIEEFNEDGQDWAELIVVSHMGAKIHVSEYLMEMNLAVDAGPDFHKKCAMLKSTKISPWLSNSGNIKYGANRPYPYLSNIKDQANRANISLNEENNEYAKRKVEDWCLRNQRAISVSSAPAVEAAESIAASSVDDITFEDSVSLAKFNQRKQCTNSPRNTDHTDNHIGLGGALTKSKIEKYADKQLPPKPSCMAFAMDEQPVAPSPKPHIPTRIQKLLEMRKQEALKNTASPKLSTDTRSNIEETHGSTTKYKQLLESTVDTTGPFEDVVKENKKQQFTAYDGTSSSTSASDISTVPSLRVRRHLEARQKQLTSAKAQVNPPANNNVQPSASKRMETLKQMKQQYSTSSKHSDIDAASSVVSSVSSSHMQYLMRMRQKHTEQNNETHVPKKENKHFDEDFFGKIAPSSAAGKQSSSKQKDQKNAFNGLRMIPAGFDLANLNHYNDEKNHWHRKKTTQHDHIPHEDADLCSSFGDMFNTTKNTESSFLDEKPSMNANVKSQNFRHTRPHTDKHKKLETVSAMGSLLDTSVPLLLEDPMSFGTDSNHSNCPTPSKSAPIRRSEALLTSITSDSIKSPSIATPFKSKKRWNLQQPSTQIKKLEEILRCADLEQDLMKLSNVNTSSSKTDSDNNEPLPAKDVNSTGSSDDEVNRLRYSNKSALLGNHKKQHEIVKEFQTNTDDLKQNVVDLSNLNVSSNKTDSDNMELLPSKDIIGPSNGDEEVTRVIDLNESAVEGNPKEGKEFEKDFQTKNTGVARTETFVSNQEHLKRIEERLQFELNGFEVEPAFQIQLPVNEKLNEVDGEHSLETKLIQHLVLAHSKVPLQPLKRIAEALLMREIFDEMQNMRITSLYRLQAYAWPHLLRGNSLFIVNAPKSGKTWSYLPAICHLVYYRLQSGNIPETFGPVAIIMVASSKQVEVVHSLCKRLLCSLPNSVSLVSSFGVRNINEVKVQLLNSCGILVATPASLLRLLRDNEKESLVDSGRLQYFVVDDMDLMLSRSQESLEEVLKTMFKMCKRVGKTKPATLGLQIVVTSRDWDAMMVAMIRRSNQPLLLIGDFLEAAVYGKVKISIKLCSSEQKIENILGFMEQYSLENERLLILCNSDDDVQEVVRSLTASGYVCIGYDSQSSTEVLTTVDEWKYKKVNTTQILVCADTSFPELKIQNVRNLIHYSMPTSWTKFTTRFSAFAQTHENYVKQDFENTTKVGGTTAHSMILLDEQNSIQLPRLMDFMKRHDQLKYIHSDILAASKRVLVSREETRIFSGTRMCPYVLEFGECDEARCDYRHNLTRFDMITKSDDIPTSGDIRVLILKVFSPTHYAARLLQHKSPKTNKWRELRRSSEVCTFGMQLNLHYLNRDSWILHWPPHVNDLCIYKMSDTFQRVRIIEAPEIKHVDIIKTVKVTVRLVDQGAVISSVKSDELFVCHDKFVQFPEQAVDIRLVGVVPFDNERTWDSKATKSVQKWIMTDINKKECVHVSINFSLTNTIWVNNVIVMEQLPTVGQYVYRVNLKRSLIQKEIGTIAGENHHSIRSIAEESDLLITRSSSESELDFKSCNGNDTTDLIKFSSNDETFESGSTGTKANDPTNAIDIKEIDQGENPDEDKDEENWDNIENNENELRIPLPPTTKKNNNQYDKISNAKKEDWGQLSLNQIVKVEIGDESENGNWADIYLQMIDDKKMRIFDELLAMCYNHVEKLKESSAFERLPDSWFQPMQNCIVHYDDRYLRAKLYGVFGGETTCSRIYRFFLCDYACFVTVKAHELYNDFLYPTTQEIVEYSQYQAVHCTLAAIRWDRFAKVFKVTKDYLYAYAVAERERAPMVMSDFNIHSFDILLYECESESNFESAKMLNTALVDAGVAKLNDDTKNYLDVGLSVFEQTEDNNEENVCNFQEFVECIQRSLELEAELEAKNIEDETKTRKILCETKAICAAAAEYPQICANQTTVEKLAPKPSTERKENEKVKPRTASKSFSNSDEEPLLSISSSEHDQSSSSLSTGNDAVGTPPPPLKALHKRPQTTWYETDYMIFIFIHAPDIEDYFLEVTYDLVYFATEIGGEEHVLILNLLGTVDPECVSHEIRGLNVVVRLVKTVYMKWPRLLRQPTKYPWLKYDLNAMNTDELDQVLPQQRLATINGGTINTNHGYSSEDSDDEKNYFQTFTPITNSEDIHDPTVEIF